MSEDLGDTADVRCYHGRSAGHCLGNRKAESFGTGRMHIDIGRPIVIRESLGRINKRNMVNHYSAAVLIGRSIADGVEMDSFRSRLIG